MAITPKIKRIQVTASVTIEQIATALGCNGFSHPFDDVTYGILTKETIGEEMPRCGFAIAGLGTTTLTVYAYVNGQVQTGTSLKTITNYMSYVVSENYSLFSSGNTNAYFGYGFIKGKNMVSSDTPEMWECYTQYSGNMNTSFIYLWDRFSTSLNQINSLVSLTNDNNLVILTPLYNPTTGWLSDGYAYFAIDRPSSYNVAGKTYTFAMNQQEYLLLTNLSISSPKSTICFNTSVIPTE